MINFFNKIKKPYFWSIFPIFGAIIFFNIILLSHTTSYRFRAPCQHLERPKEKISMPRQMERQTEGLTGPISWGHSGYFQGSEKCRPFKMQGYIKSYVHMLFVKPFGNIRLNNHMYFQNTKKSYVLDIPLFRMS